MTLLSYLLEDYVCRLRIVTGLDPNVPDMIFPLEELEKSEQKIGEWLISQVSTINR